MFKIKWFPPRFLKNMHYQGKGFYGKEKVKAVSVLMDLELIGTSREEISQQSRINIQERQKSPLQACQDAIR